MSTIQEILAAIQLIVQLLPIIASAISTFGNTEASKGLVLSALPANTPAPILKHVTGYVNNHFALASSSPTDAQIPTHA